MLATLVSTPFDEPGWVYEEKYDGIRLLAYKEGPQVSLVTRNGIDRSESFPAVARAIRGLSSTTALLDGEVIILDRKNVSRFQLLQQGGRDARYAVFDCLYLNGQDLRHQPLSHRRTVLQEIVAGEDIMLSRRLAQSGLRAFQIAKQKGFEGLVAKRLDSLYVAGRSRDWLKVKVNQQDEFIILGYTEPSGAREHFGALLLGAYSRGKLQYVGNVGTGFNRKNLASLFRKFQSLKRQRPTVENVPRVGRVTFLSPKLVAQVSYTEWTTDKRLRHPVFLGLRDDKDPKDVLIPE